MKTVKKLMVSPLNLLLKILGVDINHFWVLLDAKLKIDFRRAPNSFQSAGKKQTLIKQLFIYAFLGAIIIVSLYRISDLMLQLSVFFAFLIVFEGTILLTEFTAVLFDDNENQILLPRPVTSRTLLLVRLAHITVYMSNIALALSLPFAIYLAISHGLLSVVFLVAVILCAWFTLILAVGFYMGLARFISAERFKDVLNYFQIALAVVIMASYQLVPHYMENANVETLMFKPVWWAYLLPSVWFAGLTKFITGVGTSMDVILTCIAVGILALGSLLLIRALSLGFTALLSESRTGNAKDAKPVEQKSVKGWKNKLVALLCVSEVEKAGWQFTMQHIKSDRKLKQQVYPMFAYSLIMVIAFLKPEINDFSSYIAELANSSKYLLFVLTGFFGTIGISVIPYTDTPKAAWIYDMASTSQRYHIQSGAIKAMLFTFYLPLQVLYLIPIIWIWGISVLPYVFLGAGLSAVLAILLVRIQANPLPFSQAREMVNKGEQTLRMFLGMFLIGAIIGLVYLVSLTHVAIGIVLCVLLPLIISLSYRSVRARSIR
ncbi:hypothetical protein J1N10_00225 [Carboxylicivirga sp. A043]|uniref:hypothetical protein n=1 Tax=Carboxylicivirga litoralis TaxID=2816963 RepID=UPI0021CB5C5D|nr:hypothetical protein [Carboxylicivirga sp. A043]MCU4154385.1 hypothetical protein [Carboxylicivirga sp. A043]